MCTIESFSKHICSSSRDIHNSHRTENRQSQHPNRYRSRSKSRHNYSNQNIQKQIQTHRKTDIDLSLGIVTLMNETLLPRDTVDQIQTTIDEISVPTVHFRISFL